MRRKNRECLTSGCVKGASLSLSELLLLCRLRGQKKTQRPPAPPEVRRDKDTHWPPKGQCGSGARAQEKLLPPKCPSSLDNSTCRARGPFQAKSLTMACGQVLNNRPGGGGRSLICSIRQCLWCKHCHRGQFQGTKVRSLEQGWEGRLVAHHGVEFSPCRHKRCK